MTDLADFLLARIAEDEEVATAAAKHWNDDVIDAANAQVEIHADRFTPTRVLAECEAKRRVASNHGHELTTRGCDCEMHDDIQAFMDCGVCVEASQYAELGGWCLTLRALALPFADHPDYRQEWKP